MIHDLPALAARAAGSTEAQARTRSILASFIPPTIKPVYPGNIASRIKDGLAIPHASGIVLHTAAIRTIGDCKYAIPVLDDEGNAYRITVECVSIDEAVRG